MTIKNFFAIVATVFAAMACNAQSDVKVVGTADGVKMVYLVNAAMEPQDSAAVKDGKFCFVLPTRTTPEVMVVTTGLTRDAEGSQFVYDNEDVTIDLANDTRKGSKLNGILDDCFKAINEPLTQYRALAKAYNTATTDEERLKIGAEANALGEKIDGVIMDCYQKNSDNVVGFYLLGSQLYGDMTYDELETALQKAGDAYKDSPMFTAVHKMMKAQAKRRPGSQFTDLTMMGLDGKDHSLSEWCGKGGYVLVDFWASWCGPCRRELPNVVACYEKYRDRGFDVVGVSFDNKEDAWRKAVQELNLQWHNISDLKGWGCAASAAYGVNSIPSNILVGPDGKIVAADLRGPALVNKLAELIK